jgi:hypothetical protein
MPAPVMPRTPVKPSPCRCAAAARQSAALKRLSLSRPLPRRQSGRRQLKRCRPATASPKAAG